VILRELLGRFINGLMITPWIALSNCNRILLLQIIYAMLALFLSVLPRNYSRSKGLTLESKSDRKEDMEIAKREAARWLQGATHAGEFIHPFVQPAIGIPYSEDNSLRGFQQEHERECFEVDINSYAELYSFAKERKKHAKDWRNQDPPANVVRKWADSDDPSIATYPLYEAKVQEMKIHIAFYCIYGIVFTKCSKDDDYEDGTPFEPCDHCKAHPPRGLWNFLNRRCNNYACDPAAPCQVSPCEHKLNEEYNSLLSTLKTLKPLPRKCGLCRAEGHNRRKCPKAKGQLQKEAKKRKKGRQQRDEMPEQEPTSE